MWLLQRLLSPSTAPVVPSPAPLPEATSRRLTLKRPSRAGRSGMAPWQKVSAPVRRDSH